MSVKKPLTASLRKKRAKVFREVVDFLSRFVAPVATRRAEELLQQFKNEGFDAKVDKAVKLLTDELGLPHIDLTPEQLAVVNKKHISLEVSKATMVLARLWTKLLYESVEDTAGVSELKLSDLDGDMLPIGTLDTYFLNTGLVDTVLELEDVRGVFRSVKKNLPTGQILPESIIRFFELFDVKVIV